MMNITNTFGPYLVQRIEKPRELPPAETPDLVEFHSKPATTATREANKPAIDALEAVVPMDYMGSAEFEFGEVSKCLREIVAARATLVPFRVKVTGVPHTFVTEFEKEATKYRKSVTLQGWCLKGHEEALAKFLQGEAAKEETRYHLKQRTCLQEGCFGLLNRKRDTAGNKRKTYEFEESHIAGWLDLGQLWFVSRDEQQVKWLAHLLGVKLK